MKYFLIVPSLLYDVSCYLPGNMGMDVTCGLGNTVQVTAYKCELISPTGESFILDENSSYEEGRITCKCRVG